MVAAALVRCHKLLNGTSDAIQALMRLAATAACSLGEPSRRAAGIITLGFGLSKLAQHLCSRLGRVRVLGLLGGGVCTQRQVLIAVRCEGERGTTE